MAKLAPLSVSLSERMEMNSAGRIRNTAKMVARAVTSLRNASNKDRRYIVRKNNPRMGIHASSEATQRYEDAPMRLPFDATYEAGRLPSDSNAPAM